MSDMEALRAWPYRRTPMLVERVARAICAFHGGNPDKCISGYSWAAGEMGRAEGGEVCLKRNWQLRADEAQAAIAAILQDHVIFPKEVTNDMIIAVWEEIERHGCSEADAVTVIDAVIDAAPKVGE